MMDVLLRLLLAGLIGSSSLIVPLRAAMATSGRSTRAPRVQRAQVQDAQIEPTIYVVSAVPLEEASPDEGSGGTSSLPARQAITASVEPTRDTVLLQDDFVWDTYHVSLHPGRSPPVQF
jgi:hypothetical protein